MENQRGNRRLLEAFSFLHCPPHCEAALLSTPPCQDCLLPKWEVDNSQFPLSRFISLIEACCRTCMACTALL
ncbi:hypothetical protein BDZ91DRAFT_721586 [Kalaharituber pfeilii]|nr:hypothetical protein BDZ91DRAFT_721586 [Kalaharituber pfeilii]